MVRTRAQLGIVLVALASSIVMVLAPSSARAEDGDDSENERSHKGQFGLSAKFAVGYRGIFPYDDTQYCGDSDSVGELCLGRSPIALDLGFSYLVLEKLELLFETRLGLEDDFGVNASTKGAKLRVFAPGIRAYLQDAGTVNLFIGLQLAIDTTAYPQADETDYGIRVTPGLMLNPHKTVGLFMFFGPVVSWSRWLRVEMEGGFGLQARFP